MARFVLASRRAGRFLEREKRVARASVDFALSALSNVQSLADNLPEDPIARRVMIIEADGQEIAAKRAEMSPDVIIEPEIQHYYEVISPPDLPAQQASMPLAAGVPGVTLTVTGGGNPLPNAEVTVYLQSGATVRNLQLVSGPNGQVSVALDASWSLVAAVVVPEGGYWPVVVRGVALQAPIDCPQLPMTGPFGWWHSFINPGARQGLGSGIKVGVIDTGLWNHPNLAHVQGVGAFIGGQHSAAPAATLDVDSHGSHVTGTICARPQRAGEYAGIATDADVYVARVFAAPQMGASNADIANAIDHLSRNVGVDLINMSLGAATPSQVVQDAIQDAAERGTLCVCAAGNSAGPVGYPGAFPEVIGVSALGLAGFAPPPSISGQRMPADRTHFGQRNLYLASFSCFGVEIDCCAPGVAIIATVPNRYSPNPQYAAMDGTSMASPVACGTLAALLGADAAYKAMPRDTTRTTKARNVLVGSLQTIELAKAFQGGGIPVL